MVQDCIFCKIEKGEIPADIIYQNERVLAFRDIAPAAPVHILIIPKKHIESISNIDVSDVELVGTLILAAANIAKELGISDTGYRLIFNTGPDSGQMVGHIHLHLLGGKDLGPMVKK